MHLQFLRRFTAVLSVVFVLTVAFAAATDPALVSRSAAPSEVRRETAREVRDVATAEVLGRTEVEGESGSDQDLAAGIGPQLSTITERQAAERESGQAGEAGAQTSGLAGAVEESLRATPVDEAGADTPSGESSPFIAANGTSSSEDSEATGLTASEQTQSFTNFGGLPDGFLAGSTLSGDRCAEGRVETNWAPCRGASTPLAPVSGTPTTTAAPVQRTPTTTAAPVQRTPTTTAAPVQRTPTTTAAPVQRTPTTTAAPAQRTPTTTTAPVRQTPTASVASADQVSQALGRGFNFGDSLDARREGDWSVGIDESYFRIIADAGFDHIRLPVSWAGYADTQAPYTIRDGVDPTINHPDYTNIWDRVQWVIDQAEAHDLMVVVNMQHYDALHASPLAHTPRVIAMWEQIAERYADAGDHVLFEPLNEPHGEFTNSPEKWNDLFAKLLAVVRESNPTRPVVVGPVSYNHVDYLDDLVLPDDDYLISTVHLYEPFDFTHQGAFWLTTPRPLGIAWDADTYDYADGIVAGGWDTRSSIEDGDLVLNFDRQWAGFALDLPATQGLEEVTIEASGNGTLRLACRNGSFGSLDDADIQITSRAREFTLDLTACPVGSDGVWFQNVTSSAVEVTISNMEICTTDRGCEQVVNSAEDRLRRWVQRSAEWADDAGVPMYIGEFGTLSFANQTPIADRAAWTEVVADEANNLGLPWAYWEFHSHFGAYDLDNNEWRRPLLDALLVR